MHSMFACEGQVGCSKTATLHFLQAARLRMLSKHAWEMRDSCKAVRLPLWLLKHGVVSRCQLEGSLERRFALHPLGKYAPCALLFCLC